ncbi:MAG: hypothetical protein FGM14_08625 [Flavobacteriales bacterium]|nr:hypothetical protein [Flavobacteriales bacterium]
MKKNLFVTCLFFLLLTANVNWAQPLKLKNAVVIAQFDKSEDRYALEVTITELLTQYKIKAMPSLNLLKQGADASVLVDDTLQRDLKTAGYDTYLVVNVRGYDRTFKPATQNISFAQMLDMTSIYHLYRDEATSVSFEFTFFRNNEVVHRNVLKCGNISDRNSVLKRFRKKLPKIIEKSWK